MSSEKQRISDFGAEDAAGGADGDEDGDGRQHQPVVDWAQNNDSATNNACENCGGHITPDYQRVHSDENGVVHRCPDCSTLRERFAGKATLPDREPREHLGNAPDVMTHD